MKSLASWRGRRGLALAIVIAIVAVGLFAATAADAQTNPFGGPRPPAAPSETGIVGWLLAKQGEFYRQLSGLVRAARTDGSAVWTLIGLSFVYGIFHAAGPGHGKAVISSYLVANEETWRRGIALSFASALLQALVAIAVVGIAAAALNATARTMNTAVWWIEVFSYALIALMGARLTWVKGEGFLAALRKSRGAAESAAPHGHACAAHGHDHGHHAHVHADHVHDDHAHHHGHDHGHAHAGHDAHCGHSHGPEPADLAGPGGWRRGLAAIVAVGLRPCSGAILVLVFALAQGLFWAGIASTFAMGFGTAITVAAIATLAVGAKGMAAKLAAHRDGAGTLVVRGIETAAAVVVLVFGVALLMGYMASERMVGM